MADVKIYPEKRLDKSGTLITINVPLILKYSIKGDRRIEFSTGYRLDLGEPITKTVNGKEKISFKNWNEEKMTVPKNVTRSALINAHLLSLRNIIENAELKAARTQSPITYASLKWELDIFTGRAKQLPSKDVTPPTPVKVVTPIEAVQEWIIDRTDKEAVSSVKNIKVFNTHLSAFVKLHYKAFTFDNVDLTFYEKFCRYLTNVKKHSINTLAKLTKLLSRFLRWADKRNYVTNIAYKEFKWVSEDVPDVIALDESELQLLENSIMPTVALERVRDVFLFQFYCGMRYADVENLKKSDVDGDYIRFFIQKKTKGRIEHVVPLHKRAKAIIDKYQELPGDRALPVLTNQKMNDALKTVGKEANLNKNVKKKMVYGNQSVISDTPKHELLSTHMARKGFITIAISKNVPEAKIKAITGHEKNSRAFGRYYEVAKEDKKDSVDSMFGI